MEKFLFFFEEFLNIFDLIVFLLIIFFIVRCSIKGFTLSLLSFSKWLIALIFTIIFVPKLKPWVSNYFESDFITDVGLGIFLFLISLFIVIIVAKGISKAVVWTGLGVADKTFGSIFGIFKGYIVCICIFSKLNWFYPYKKWPIETEKALTFPMIYEGSRVLIKELPERQKDINKTKKKIEKI